ncbi:MAG: flagellin [Pseudohongiellaceae bacterium]
MSIINTNMSGIIATNAIIKNERDQATAMERLSTGLRINSAGDDAAGLAISERMAAEVSGLKMANRNAQDAISMLETAEGASVEIVSMLQRMRELALQASTDTNSATDRVALDLEFGQLMNEIVSIASQTTWNTMTIMNGGAPGAADLTTSAVVQMQANIHLGKNASQSTVVSIKSWDPRNTIDVDTAPGRIARDGLAASTFAAGGAESDQYTGTLGGTVANQSNSAFGQARLWTGGDDVTLAGADIAGGAQNADKRINIETRAAANDALTQLDRAITSASSERAMYGAYINRMEHTGNNLTNVARHQEQSRSRIADADYAVESTELSRTTIIAQASTAMLAQANQSKSIVLALLE